jgi:hypothetical protein
MGITMSSVLRFCQRSLGYPRFKFLSDDEIVDIIQEDVINDFTPYFPYKTIFALDPALDLVDDINFPGLFKIEPLDCDINRIYDTGMVFVRNDIAVGGYPRDMGRTVYGGSMGIGALLYNQLNVNIMSMMQGQQTTGEYIQPNFIQIYPKRRWFGGTNQILIELLLYHAPDLHTIPNAYERIFKELTVLWVKSRIYERYKDLEDETYAGHAVRTKVQSYSNAEDSLNSLHEKMDEESFRNPDRFDLPVI